MKDQIILFQDKRDCCGCGACFNICSKHAISMCEDEYGFIYPKIDEGLCIKCGMCQRVCAYQTMGESAVPIETFVAAANDKNIITSSASGGIFASIAKEVLNNNGIVFGCSMEIEDQMITPKHIRIVNEEELIRLQGSKYVQSCIGDIYQQVKSDLILEKTVLFSGTPCQVAALRTYLGNEKYENLYTVDIICHGVPSAALFQSYIKEFEKKLKGNIIGFKFRDKTGGWGLKGKVTYIDKSKRKRTKLLPVQLSSYYKLFLDSDTYRETCYECKYATPHRVGDLTIGDYWGIEREHPEYLIGHGGDMDTQKGISCLIVNTQHGKRLLEQFGTSLDLRPSSFEKAKAENRQLSYPSTVSKNREQILELYRLNGYKAVDSWYNKKLGIRKYVYHVWNIIPVKVQKTLKHLYKKLW